MSTKNPATTAWSRKYGSNVIISRGMNLLRKSNRKEEMKKNIEKKRKMNDMKMKEGEERKILQLAVF